MKKIKNTGKDGKKISLSQKIDLKNTFETFVDSRF